MYNLHIQLVIHAYDNAFPEDKTEGVLTVNVDRNPIAPRPDRTIIVVNISDNFPTGGEVVTILANDSSQVCILL